MSMDGLFAERRDDRHSRVERAERLLARHSAIVARSKSRRLNRRITSVLRRLALCREQRKAMTQSMNEGQREQLGLTVPNISSAPRARTGTNQEIAADLRCREIWRIFCSATSQRFAEDRASFSGFGAKTRKCEPGRFGTAR